ncbi:MAG: glycosyltransferase family 4 protein [Dehalococcoidia bacterium]|jgi:glycosyltransferase involved in cell wall biosynthesis
MKKVCILTSVHSPFDHRIFFKQARCLQKAGYKLTIIAQHNGNELVDDIELVALPRARNRIQRITGTWRVFKLALRQKADIYHFHDPELLFWGWLLQILSGKPVIYDVHENYAETLLLRDWLPKYLRKSVAWIFTRTERIFAGRLAAIITVSEPMTKRFAGFQTVCTAVHNFPDLNVSKSYEKYGPSAENDQYSLIYTGNMTREMGFPIILDTLTLLSQRQPAVTCLILAKSDNMEWLNNNQRETMKELVAAGTLKILERVPHNEVFKYIRLSSIGWRPGPPFQEGISTKTLEYMACGIPVVSSDVSIISRIIRESECGILVDPYNAKEHAHAILHLLDHPEEARHMGENGRKAVMQKYNWEIEEKKLLDVYNRCLSRGAG